MRCKDVNSIKPTAYGKLFRKKNNKTQNVENKEWRVNMPMKRVSVFCNKKKKRVWPSLITMAENPRQKERKEERRKKHRAESERIKKRL